VGIRPGKPFASRLRYFIEVLDFIRATTTKKANMVIETNTWIDDAGWLIERVVFDNGVQIIRYDGDNDHLTVKTGPEDDAEILIMTKAQVVEYVHEDFTLPRLP
jgi:hypothetical protein